MFETKLKFWSGGDRLIIFHIEGHSNAYDTGAKRGGGRCSVFGGHFAIAYLKTIYQI